MLDLECARIRVKGYSEQDNVSPRFYQTNQGNYTLLEHLIFVVLNCYLNLYSFT